MLYISGRFSGKDVDGVVAPSEIATKYKLPKAPEGDASVVLDLHPTLMLKDRHQQPRQPRTISPALEFAVNGADDSFTIRYFTSRSGSKDNPAYSPASRSIAGQALVCGADDYDFFVFMCLYPATSTSPFYNGTKPLFQFVDRDAAALESSARLVRISALQDLIVRQLTDGNVTVRAKGIKVRGESVNLAAANGNPQMEASIARYELVRLLNKYPQEFEAAWADPGTWTTGLVRDAADNGIITFKAAARAGGRRGWYWKQDNRLICAVPENAEPFREIIVWAMAAGNEEFLPTLSKMLSVPVEATVEVKNEDHAPSALVAALVAQGTLVYNDREGVVMLYNSDDDAEGEVLVSPVNRQSYMSDTVTAIAKNPEMATRLIKLLNK